MAFSDLIPNFKRIITKPIIKRGSVVLSEIGVLLVLTPLMAGLYKVFGSLVSIQRKNEVFSDDFFLLKILEQGAYLLLSNLVITGLVAVVYTLSKLLGRTRFFFPSVIIGVLLVCWIGYQAIGISELVEEIKNAKDSNPRFFSEFNQIMLPFGVHQIGFLGIWLLAIMCGLLSVIRSFSKAKFMIGWVVGTLISCTLSFWFVRDWIDWSYLPSFIAWIAFGWTMVSFDGFRNPLSQVSGIDLSKQETSGTLQSYSPFTNYFFVTITVTASVILIGMFGYSGLMNEAMKTIEGTNKPVVYPQGINGADFLREKFSRENDTVILDDMKFLDSLTNIHNSQPELYTVEALQEYHQLIQDRDLETVSKDEESLRPYVLAFAEAAYDSDYFQYRTLDQNEGVSFLLIRQISRAISGRARIAISEQRLDDALVDIEVLIDFSHRFCNDLNPHLVHIMVGLVVRDIALDTLVFAYFANRDNVENLIQIDNMMKRNRQQLREVFPSNGSLTGEIGDWKIVPMADIVVPSYRSSVIRWYQVWVKMDQLETAIALEMYKEEVGEYPDALVYLIPRYLDSHPVDVISNDAFPYEQKGETFHLDYDHLAKQIISGMNGGYNFETIIDQNVAGSWNLYFKNNRNQ